MSHGTKLLTGFSLLLMVRLFAGCNADTTIGTVGGGSGGAESPGGTGGTMSGSGGRGDVDGSADVYEGTGGSAVDAPRIDNTIDNTTCCPRDQTMSGCMHLGGSSDQMFGCTLVCEFYCSENWRVVKDQHGCEGWVFSIRKPAPGEDLRCMTGRDATIDSSFDANGEFDAGATSEDAATDG